MNKIHYWGTWDTCTGPGCENSVQLSSGPISLFLLFLFICFSAWPRADITSLTQMNIFGEMLAKKANSVWIHAHSYGCTLTSTPSLIQIFQSNSNRFPPRPPHVPNFVYFTYIGKIEMLTLAECRYHCIWFDFFFSPFSARIISREYRAARDARLTRHSGARNRPRFFHQWDDSWLEKGLISSKSLLLRVYCFVFLATLCDD